MTAAVSGVRLRPRPSIRLMGGEVVGSDHPPSDPARQPYGVHDGQPSTDTEIHGRWQPPQRDDVVAALDPRKISPNRWCGSRAAKRRIREALEAETTFEDFFAAARLNPAASMITASVCGVRVQDVDDPLMPRIRYLDKLVDELAKGKP